MKIKNNKGLTGVDVTIAVIILTIFISLIANMFYNVSQIGNAVNRKSEATYVAVQIIEAMKQVNYDDLPTGLTEDTTAINLEKLNELLIDEDKIVLKNGYSVDINVENYKKIKGEKEGEELEDILKRVTVTVKYNEKAKEQTVELTTVVVREEEATV